MTLLLPAVAWLAGMVAGALGFGPFWFLALAEGLLGVFLRWAGWKKLGSALILLTLVFLVSLARFESARPTVGADSVAHFNDGAAVRLRGVVNKEPEERETSQRLHLRVESIETQDGWRDVTGTVLLTARPFPRFQYGDVLLVRGELETPPIFDDFDYRDYLARQGIVSLAAYASIERIGSGEGNDVLSALGKARRAMGESLKRALPEPESSLARGILLGQRASIPRELNDDFNDAGISHLVAISGFNVMLVAGVVSSGLAWAMGRRQATVIALVAVVLFALFVGTTPSVVRATAMAWVVLGAYLVGRPNSATGAVFVAGAVITAIEPSLVQDVSFQLSFAATVGIVVLARPLRHWLDDRTSGRMAMLTEPTAVTIAASLAAQPIIIVNFERLSLVTLPANILALPGFLAVLLGSLFTSLAGLVYGPFGRLAGDVAYLPLAYLIWVGRTAASVPFAAVSLGDVSTLEAVVIYVPFCLILWFFAYRRWQPAKRDTEPSLVKLKPFRLQPLTLVTLALLLLSAFVWRDTLAAGEDHLVVSILDVGQGDAILIETPSGQRVLIDGGPSESRLLRALGQELPARVRDIDLMVLTHAQDDHVTGLVGVLERYEVGNVLTSPLIGQSGAYIAWRDGLEHAGVVLRHAVQGEWIDLGGGVRIEILSPPEPLLRGSRDDVNNSSVVLRLVYGEVSFLLTGDLAEEGESELLRSGVALRSTVLKLGHHGSDASSSADFLAAVASELAVVSVGAENGYGHPSPTTRLRLGETPLLRTDLHGTIVMKTDGVTVRVKTERSKRDLNQLVPGVEVPSLDGSLMLNP